MITVTERGLYRLIETKNHTKIITLDDNASFAWISAGEIGEILVVSHKKHNTDYVLSIGNYRIYSVKNEPNLSDQMHLELRVGLGEWQGYLLPTGLPKDDDKRKRIIPTNELITTFNEAANPPSSEYHAL
ncbi:MAG TPA: hypothetical protein VF189_02450 [Patescibacteria group bacterium]